MELSRAEKDFITEVNAYAENIKRAYADDTTVEGNPEDQLKRPVRELLESKYSGQVETRTESQVEGLGARPDIGVGVQNLLAGHIELKAPGIGANKNNFTGANYQQWKKYRNLPNLIYTDGTEWILYRDGERVSKIVRFDGDIIEEGAEAVSQDNAIELHNLVTDFLNWDPIVPDDPKALAKTLAPLCRLLRDDVEQAVSKENSDIRRLFEDWKRLFFPEADEKKFADAYAQTLTYALLLARLSGAEDLAPDEAADLLESGHGLLAQTLRLLGQEDAREEISTGVDTLQRVIRAIDPEALERDRDLWLYFYEDFLAAYDSDLRKNYGVYYTPAEVIGCQVRLGAEILENRFNKSLGYADEGVTYLDPAAGTAAYPLAAIQHGLDKVENKYGSGMVPSKASEMAQNFHAFEYMVGPYAVGHLRISKALQDAGANIPEDGLKIFLTNTLDNPDADPPRFSFAESEIAEEHERAKEIKKDTRILVCMGNPPYDRQEKEDTDSEIQRKGGWVRFGEDPDNNTETVGILRDFVEGAPGIHAKNLYNDYVYFWRWALWKLFENEHSSGPGILSFITASSYLRGPGFTQMRRQFREEFDDVWIIDLEGDSLGARKTENVFNIRTAVAIAIGVRYDKPDHEAPATVRYTKITGSREEKLSKLDRIDSFEDLDWENCFTEWEKPLLPEGEGSYFDWPLLTDIFPWQHSGCQFKRTWPVAPTENLLERRWDQLVSSGSEERAELFKETRDRVITRTYSSDVNPIDSGPPIAELSEDDEMPNTEKYGFRSFDRQRCIVDKRIGDYLRTDLWRTTSGNQIYMTSILTDVLGEGPAASITNNVPDMHHFSGRGGKDVIPLWKDGSATLANITQGILNDLQEEVDTVVTVEHLFAYSYGILATPQYTEKFSEELSIPGPRLPITKDSELFERVVANGKYLIWLHTYGNQFVPENEEPGEVPSGTARCTSGISNDPDQYPNEYSYNDETQTLVIGDGRIVGVAPEVWNFSVSGLEVVKSWLDYRMEDGAGRRSSPLDDIRPERWTSQMTRELLELLWVLEHTINRYPEMESDLENVVQSECFEADELPTPRESERTPPADTGDQTSMNI